MRKFLINGVLFVLPIILSFVVLEIIVGGIPNSYSYKYNYVKKHGREIEAIAIGHSQLYDGFKPESFALPAFNLCNSAQTYVDNYYLLRELLPSMPHLKMVIMPIGYMDVGVGRDVSNFSYRSGYYHKYMHIDYGWQLPFKYAFESLRPLWASQKVYLHYFKHGDVVGCDSLGRRNTHSLRNRIYPLGYDKLMKRYSRKAHGNFCLRDEAYFIGVIESLLKKGISVVLVSPPYHQICFRNYNTDQLQFFKDYMKTLCGKYPVRYIDLEGDTTFTDDDFFNETHVSEYGAEKLTRRLNNELGL